MNTRKFISILLYVIVVVLFFEGVLRFCFPIREIENFDRINYMILKYDGGGSIHARQQKWQWQSSPDTLATFVHEMNRYGFRDHEWEVEKDPNRPRALFIGDSFVEGMMVTNSETLTEAFHHASGDQNYEALNGGMLGTSLSAYTQLATDMIPVFKPDVAFLCIYANDLGQHKAVVPSFYLKPTYFNPFKPRLLEILDQQKTYGPLLFRYFNTPKTYFSPTPSKGNPWTEKEAELGPSVAPRLANAMKKGTFNPYLAEKLFKEEQYLKKEPETYDAIEFFQYTCLKFGTKPVIVYIPSRNQVSNHYLFYEQEYAKQKGKNIKSLSGHTYQLHQRTIQKQCEGLDMQFIDLSDAIRKKEAAGKHLYWNYDQHMRAGGYKLIGEEIWRAWSTEGSTYKNASSL